MARFLPNFGSYSILVLADTDTTIYLPNPLVGGGPLAAGTIFNIVDNLGIAGSTPIRPVGPLIESSLGEALINIKYGGIGLRWIDSHGYILVNIDPATGPPGPPGPPGSGTFVFQNAGAPYTLPTNPTLYEQVTVIDNSGTPGTVVNTADGSLINGQTTFAGFLQPFASFGFVWNGTGWRIV